MIGPKKEGEEQKETAVGGRRLCDGSEKDAVSVCPVSRNEQRRLGRVRVQ